MTTSVSSNPMKDDGDRELNEMMFQIRKYWTTADGEPELKEFAEYVLALIQSHTAKAVLEARIDTAQFAQNLIRDALAVNADTRKISRFGATDEVLERFISELAALKQGPTNAK